MLANLPVALLIFALSSAAVAASPVQLAIPAGSLAAALASLSRQAHVDIGGVDPTLGGAVTRGLSGTMGVTAALDRLLDGTPFVARRVGADAFRISRRYALAPAPAPASPAPADQEVPLDPGGSEIVITGGKRPVTLASYPGSATVILLGDDPFGPNGSNGQAYLLRQSPILQSTELGSGRNKLFIRGIADSSFTGPTQSTAGTYFGDVRTGYNGPDPNLNLYDVERIEILEGPQGALYGAGSIGGVIRLAPRPAALDRASASAQLGISQVAHGGIGYDSAAMVNYAPWADHLGLRAVAYRDVEAGYIDDPGRGRKNINRATETGGRIAARLRPFDGWTIDGSFLIQSSRQPDLQYALLGDSMLTRRAATAQPFSDDYRMLRGVLNKEWSGGVRLIASFGRVSHETDQRYDATRPGNFANPTTYDEHNAIRLTTSEVRLSDYDARGSGWLIGAALVDDSTTKSRQFGTLATQRELIGISNRTKEKAVFASISQRIGSNILATAGARYTSARQDGDPSSRPTNQTFIRGQRTKRVDPQVGVSAQIAPRMTVFAQYQQGFRTGGLAVAAGVGRVANFEDDRIYVGEIGARMTRTGPTGLAAVAAVSFASWRDIQADLVSMRGFPYTANVGDGRILAFEGSLDWVPLPGLRATAGVFVNRSRLINPAPDFISSGSRPLPATPALSATGSLSWKHRIAWGGLTVAGNARYVGHSRLGVGPILDLPYGNYVETGLTSALRLSRYELSLTIDNVLDARGNRFAIGNPFGVAYRDEATPLRPRRIRIGAKVDI